MNPDVKQMWLDALRSGEYNQTQGWLARENILTGERGYCCLGVLCELAVKQGIIQNTGLSAEALGVFTFDGEESVLPKAVAEWAGTDSWGNPAHFSNTQSLDLPEHNDQGMSFERIANIIEKGEMGVND